MFQNVFRYFSKTHYPLLTLDIREDLMRIAVIGLKYSRKNLLYIAREDFNSSAALSHQAEFTQAIKKAVNEINIPLSKALIIVPDHSALIKNQVMDASMPRAEIENQIWLQASHGFCDPLNQLYFDFDIYQEREAHHFNLIRMIAIKKNQIDSYVSLLKRFGISVLGVEIASQAMSLALSGMMKNFLHDHEAIPVAVVQLMGKELLQTVFYRHRCIFSRLDVIKNTINHQVVNEHFQKFMKEFSSLLPMFRIKKIVSLSDQKEIDSCISSSPDSLSMNRSKDWYTHLEIDLAKQPIKSSLKEHWGCFSLILRAGSYVN